MGIVAHKPRDRQFYSMLGTPASPTRCGRCQSNRLFRAAENAVDQAPFLGFLAMVSVSLGVLNLLPLPVLDGGHLMYYLFEGVTGRPVSELWLERLQRGGVAIMLMMMSLALYNDVARLLGLQ